MHLSFLFAALAIVWAGILLYIWTLRRGVQRLTEQLAGLPPAAEADPGTDGRPV